MEVIMHFLKQLIIKIGIIKTDFGGIWGLLPNSHILRNVKSLLIIPIDTARLIPIITVSN